MLLNNHSLFTSYNYLIVRYFIVCVWYSVLRFCVCMKSQFSCGLSSMPYLIIINSFFSWFFHKSSVWTTMFLRQNNIDECNFYGFCRGSILIGCNWELSVVVLGFKSYFLCISFSPNSFFLHPFKFHQKTNSYSWIFFSA